MEVESLMLHNGTIGRYWRGPERTTVHYMNRLIRLLVPALFLVLSAEVNAEPDDLQRQIEAIRDAKQTAEARLAAIKLATQTATKEVRETLCRLLPDENSDLARAAAEALSKCLPKEKEELDA